jgi:hypothetical protein
VKLAFVGLRDSVNLLCSFASVPSVRRLKPGSNLFELTEFGELSGESLRVPETKSFLIKLSRLKKHFLRKMPKSHEIS